MSPPDEIPHMDLPTLAAFITDLEAKFAQQAAAAPPTAPPPSTTPAPSRPLRQERAGTVAHRHAVQGRAGQPGAAPGEAPVLCADCPGVSGGGTTTGRRQRGPWNLKTWKTAYGGMKR